ncbi:MAG: hypothetical protein MUO52_11505 [Desulfobacterales bacterium]|nr:hypothetical protein [Desulfobacterales bacterium]
MDQLNLERLSVPTVTIVTTPFAQLAKTVAAAEGIREACFVLVPHPIGMLPAADVRKKAENAFPAILEAATDWSPPSGAVDEKSPYPAEVVELSGTIQDLNNHFLTQKWSLGLPIIPPTPEFVRAMLKGTGRKPDEILGPVPPGMGALTVELVAVHAVMAGCRPEYMPLLIAALQGFMVTEANWRGALSTTGTTQLIVMVNGPIVKKIGIACEQGAAGKGQHANGSIGHAINLIAYTVGGSKPPSIDRSTLGSPADYVCWVFGENEGALPAGWKPLHVERGFQESDSVVTVMGGYPPVENIDHWSVSPEEHIRWWSHIVSPMHNMGGPALSQVMELNPIIAIGPEHAQLMASEGWSKDDFRRAFWEKTRISASAWPAGCPEWDKLGEKLGAMTPETMIPITNEPEQFLIIITGGDGKHSHYFAPFPGCYPVSRLVEE